MISIYFFNLIGEELNVLHSIDGEGFLAVDPAIGMAKRHLKAEREYQCALLVDEKLGEGFMRIHKAGDEFVVYAQSECAPEMRVHSEGPDREVVKEVYEPLQNSTGAIPLKSKPVMFGKGQIVLAYIPRQKEYVTWWMREDGATFNGHYTRDLEDAMDEFGKRNS